jgi:hypothetical protein
MAPGLAFIAVGSGDDLEYVPAGIVEVDASATVLRVDLTWLAVARIGPVVQASLADAPEDPVEVILGSEEGVGL